MKIPYLGRISLYWCHKCNVPVLGKSCGGCKEATENLPITPPGDIRPAFKRDISIINKTVEAQFGTPLLTEERVALLNRVSGLDRFDEVILDGNVMGAIRYDIGSLSYQFMPRVEGADRIWKNCNRGFVRVSEDAAEYILKGCSVLMPGVKDYDPCLGKGEEVIVVSKNSVIAVGKTRFSAEEASRRKKGMFVKVRKSRTEAISETHPPGQDWDQVVRCNMEVLERYEKEALSFIRKTLKNNRIPVVVSFSGGKDSLATLLLVRKIVDPPVLFIDTGVEYPDTIEYVEELAQKMDLKLIRASAGERFWDGLKIFGMSGRDYRWCCKVCKLGPVAKVINELFPEGVLNFIGQRKYESEKRAKSGRTFRNSWLPKQISASPVQHWTSLHIWLFLMSQKAHINPLYYSGYERIGCWPCPSSSLDEIQYLKEDYPELWSRLESELASVGLKADWVNYGFWRWRTLPKGQRDLKIKLGASCEITETVFGDTTNDSERIDNLSNKLDAPAKSLAMRSNLCLGCGVCLAHCEMGAIEFLGGKIWINNRCTGCGKCHLRCPIVNYIYNKNYN